jgi:hypothetical protein
MTVSACRSTDKPIKQDESDLIEQSHSSTKEPKEAYESIDISEFNNALSRRSEKLSPVEIMKLYYPHEASQEGREIITINEKNLGNKTREVILIHDYLNDDSVKAYKYVMTFKKKADHWTLIALKKNWKCYENRGHTNWGIERCK